MNIKLNNKEHTSLTMFKLMVHENIKLLLELLE